MPEDELKFLCRETSCQHNNRPYCKAVEEGRPIIIAGPHGSCQQYESKKEKESHG